MTALPRGGFKRGGCRVMPAGVTTMHTKGTWAADGDGIEFEINSDGDKWKAVAQCSANKLGASEVTPEEAQANAWLIAAAPNLLAVAKSLVEGKPIDAIVKAAKRAVHKAEAGTTVLPEEL